MGELGLVGVPFISVDNELGAYLVARHLSQQLDGPAEVLILEGIPSARNAVDRTAGALRAFGEHPHITVAAVASAHWKIDEAHDVARELLEAHPGARAIFCANDMMALGALSYLAKAGRDEVLVGGFDALAEARQAVVAGRLAATVDQQAAKQGYLGVAYAVRLLAGEQLPPETMVPVKLVTAANS
jgi:ribose transport system substrate-binding protein